jgi:hypothetical protein
MSLKSCTSPERNALYISIAKVANLEVPKEELIAEE